MGAAPSPDQHDPRLCMCRAGTALPTARLHGTSLPAWPEPQQGSPASLSGPARAAPCQDLSSSPASPPGWKGDDSLARACPPPGRQRRALVPCRDVSGPGGCPHPSPGTVGWRQRGHHRQRAIPNPPAAQCKDQRDGFRREPAPSPSSAVPGPNPAWCQLPGLEPRPPSLRGTPRGILGAWYQEAAPAGGGPEVGTAPFPHVDQAPLRHGAARLQHQLLGPEDPRLALGGMERFTAQPGRVGQLDGLGGLPAAAVRTHPEIGVGGRGLHLRDVSIWRAQRGWGGSQGALAQGLDAPVGAGWENQLRCQGPMQGGVAPAPRKGGKTSQKVFLWRLAPPKYLRNALTCCPACVGSCLQRQRGGLLVPLGTGMPFPVHGEGTGSLSGTARPWLTGCLQGGWGRMG